MNKQFKNDYHRRVKEASTQLHYYNLNAPDPDPSWPECFWKFSFPFDLSKHNTRARNRGFIAWCEKKIEKSEHHSFWNVQEQWYSPSDLVLLRKFFSFAVRQGRIEDKGSKVQPFCHFLLKMQFCGPASWADLGWILCTGSPIWSSTSLYFRIKNRPWQTVVSQIRVYNSVFQLG